MVTAVGDDLRRSGLRILARPNMSRQPLNDQVAILHVDLFYLPEAMRGSGLGSRMLQQAEEEAIRRGCHTSWLDTFSFQAPEFYRRQGYAVFGEIEGYAPGHSRYFLKKALITRTAEPRPAESEQPTTKDKA